MLRHLVPGILLGLTLCFSPALAEPPLTLEHAEQLALQRNLGHRAAAWNLSAAQERLRGAGGVYDPLLTLAADTQSDRRRLNSISISATGVSTTDGQTAEGSLAQKLPTGATITASLGTGRTDSTPSPAINPSYESDATIAISQPLLRDRGRTVTEQGILRQGHLTDAAAQDLRASAAGVLQQVRSSWYDILRLQQLVELRRASVAVARRLEQDNQARVDAGLLPPVELLGAQVGVQTRLQELDDAQRQLADARSALAVQIQAAVPEALDGRIPEPTTLEFDAARALQQALVQRPELLRFEADLARTDLELRLARNQRLPQLDLSAAYSHRTLEEELGDSLGELSSDEQNAWSAGLLFSYPLGNREREGSLGAAIYERRRVEALFRQAREETRQSIDSALRALDVSRRTVETARLEGQLADERLRILLERQRVGLATVRDVLEGEEDLTAARNREITALAAYQQARDQFLLASGLLLVDAGIEVAVPLATN